MSIELESLLLLHPRAWYYEHGSLVAMCSVALISISRVRRKLVVFFDDLRNFLFKQTSLFGGSPSPGYSSRRTTLDRGTAAPTGKQQQSNASSVSSKNIKAMQHLASMALVLTLYLAIWTSTSNAAPIPPIRGLTSGIAGGSSRESQSSKSKPGGSSSWIFSSSSIPSLDLSRRLKSQPKPELPARGTVNRLGPPVDRSRKPGPPVDRSRKPGPPVDRSRKPTGDPFSTVKTKPYMFLLPKPRPAASVKTPKKQEVAGFDKPVKQETGSLDRPSKLQGTSGELTQKQQQPVPQKQQYPPPLPAKQQAGVSVAGEQHVKESLKKQGAAPEEQQQNAEPPVTESREFKLANGDTYWTVKRVSQPLTDADVRPKDGGRHSKEVKDGSRHLKQITNVEAEEEEEEEEEGAEDFHSKIEELRKLLTDAESQLQGARPRRVLASEELNLADGGNQPSSPARRIRQPSPVDETADGRQPRILSSVDELEVANGKVYSSVSGGIRGRPLTVADRMFLSPRTRGREDVKATFREIDKAMSFVPVDLSNANPVATSRRTGRVSLASLKGLLAKKRGRKGENSPEAKKKLKMEDSMSEENAVTIPRRSRFARIKDALTRPFRKRRRNGAKTEKEKTQKKERKKERKTGKGEKNAEGKTGRDSSRSRTRLSTWLWDKKMGRRQKISR
ncbi:hypothetical protein L249_5002 [Ophiocordyceps polyrhachis-furcata BCC 54312]|uniref:Uncharacterized protein n=1 Tax=Ophiocordyceps polyrhachis-furcata BCC 54312 TaxID=1330021 RepID=A0A367L348_9HYPO|nr:hypothetical protein L249_5002 [Ophiocordyceps polyrhachis-furcata BCC 54312]